MITATILAALLQVGQPPCGWQPTGGWPLDTTYSVEVPNQTDEVYYIQGPAVIHGNHPLVVLFHGFTGSHDEHNSANWGSYGLIDWARSPANLDAFVMMHDGGEAVTPMAGFNTFGNENFQRATAAAIADAVCKFPIDENRIYGVGFSMGAGEVLAYAARHLDPTQPMFAAVVTQSGYPAPSYTVLREPCSIGSFLSTEYGGDWCSNRFGWQRASILDTPCLWCDSSMVGCSAGTGCTVDPACGLPCGPIDQQVWPVGVNEIDRMVSQASNLIWMPTQAYYGVDLSTGNTEAVVVVESNDLLDAWFDIIPSSPHWLTQVDCGTAGATCDPLSGPVAGCTMGFPQHTWDAVCADWVTDFLATRTKGGVGDPSAPGWLDTAFGLANLTLFAEDSTRFYNFEVTRASSNDFGRVIWKYDDPLVDLRLTFIPVPGPYVENVTRVRIRADDEYGVLRTVQSQQSDPPIDIQTPAAWVSASYPAIIELEVTGYLTPPRAVVQKGLTTSTTQMVTIDHDAIAGVISWDVVGITGEPDQDYLFTIMH